MEDTVKQDTLVEELNAFIEERESIRVKKEAGLPRPWTTNPILHKYKFCNVQREDDRTTRWIANNWREPHHDDPDLWFALVVARRALNWPGSMQDLGYPVPWNPDHFKYTMHLRADLGEKSYDTAYQLLVQGQKGDKSDNMVYHILDPLWEARGHIRPRFDDTLQSFFERLSAFKYMGLFYTGQVVADLKYVQLLNAPDWHSFAVPGPGSERGLNRVLGRDPKSPWTVKGWQEELAKLHKQIRMDIHAQDLQNVLCEWDKYERARLSTGGKVRPYHPHDNLSDSQPDESESLHRSS